MGNRTFVLLGPMALLLTTAAAGCAGQGADRPPGSGAPAVELRVEMEGAPAVDHLRYRAEGNGMLPVVGSVAVPATPAAVTVTLPGLAPGSGYKVELRAESADGQALCRGAFAFDLATSRPPATRVVLLCRPQDPAEAAPPEGRSCPALDSYGASSFTAPVGARIQLFATGSDDNAKDVLRYRWSADHGRLSGGAGPRTEFLCEAPGVYSVTAAVDDGWCTTGVFFTLTCTSGSAGPLARR
jgi:hypothetical protein